MDPPMSILKPRQASATIAASDFLRRGYQASVVAGDWIYIDGGEFSFLDNGIPQFQYASTLLSINLSQNWTNATVVIQSTIKPDNAPNLNTPSLWYHASENLIYSGFAGWNSTFGDAPSLPPLSLWTFQPDGNGSGIWNEIIAAGSSVWSQLTRPGQPLMAFGPTNAWVLGGITSEWNGWASPENLIPGMIQFDMDARVFSNSTVQCCNATAGIYKGALHHVPSFGPGGIFIAMGGQNGIGNDGITAGLIDFGTVSIFDPTKREWWNQTTTGSQPIPRVEFCTAGINSTNGTYEIFVYAGWGTHLGTRAIQYDTINILTLPAFHWISVPYNPKSPRHGLSCTAVGGSQILTIGGVDSNSQVTGGAIESIVESTFDTSPDPFAQGLAIFDMTALTFANQYTAGALPYEQSEVVKQFYTRSNGTYMNHITPEVSALLRFTDFTNSTSISSSKSSSTISNTPASESPSKPSNESSIKSSIPPTPSPPRPSDLTTGDIAGIATACFSFFLAVAVGVVYLSKRRRARQRSNPANKTGAPVNFEYHKSSDMDGRGRAAELHGQAVSELQEQVALELEHTRPPVELDTAYPNRQIRLRN